MTTEAFVINFLLLPFNVDVTHLLPTDADIIQDDITGVPDDATQEKPEQEQMWLPQLLMDLLMYWLLSVYSQCELTDWFNNWLHS